MHIFKAHITVIYKLPYSPLMFQRDLQTVASWSLTYDNQPWQAVLT